MKHLSWLVVSFSLILCSCSGIFAGTVADQIVENTLAIRAFEGEFFENQGRPGLERIVTRVQYKKPWKTRAQVIEPKSMAGSLFIFDGSTIIMWWSKELFGVKVHGLTTPSTRDIKKLASEDVLWSWDKYAWQFAGTNKIANRPVAGWKATPFKAAPYYFPHESWADHEFSTPLSLVIWDSPGHVWYEMGFTQINFDAQVDDSAFEFEFPPNAVVFEWDMTDRTMPLKEIQALMNFTILMPKSFPSGLGVTKIIKGRHCLPMTSVIMENNGRQLTLTQARAMSQDFAPATGIKVEFGGKTGYLSFFGAFSSLTWVQENTALTLLGNVAYPELIAVAASVE